MSKNKRKIGIMGGTFDPVHMGHLLLGECAYEQLKLDKVLYMPSGNPPQKKNRPGCASDAPRVEMVRLAIADNPHFELSLLEMHEDGYSYTYRTLERLTQEHSDTEYYFIIGADSLFALEEWKEPGRILRACPLVAAGRDQATKRELKAEILRLQNRYGGKILYLPSPNIEISSHDIRKRVRAGESIKYYLPEAVIRYIEEQQIYQNAEEGCEHGQQQQL